MVWEVQDQLVTRESQTGLFGAAEGFVVPMKPGNAGGGTGPQFKTNATREVPVGGRARSTGDPRGKRLAGREVGKVRSTDEAG